MIKKARPVLLVKILLFLLGLGLLVFTALDIYRHWVRSQSVNQELVQFYTPNLNLKMIKRAAEILK